METLSLARLRAENERLRAEHEGMKAVCDSYADENQRFYDENERLREALGRIADMSPERSERTGLFTASPATVLAGCKREARAALLAAAYARPVPEGAVEMERAGPVRVIPPAGLVQTIMRARDHDNSQTPMEFAEMIAAAVLAYWERTAPTEEEIARVLCCPQGCMADGDGTDCVAMACYVDQRRAVLALIGRRG